MIDEEHTSLTAAVAALGDDQSPRPTIERIAATRAAEVRERVIDVLATAVACDWSMVNAERDFAHVVLDELEAAGFAVVLRRPE